MKKKRTNSTSRTNRSIVETKMITKQVRMKNGSFSTAPRIAKLLIWQQWVWTGIFLQALVATIGSLYYSTFGDPVANLASGNLFPMTGGFEPCLLCWFARILMYPIVAISYVGILKQDRRFTDYILPLVALGIPLELYHYALQKLPIETIFGCSLDNPCNALQINYLGFITIPFLCLVAFSVIGVLVGVNWWMNREIDKEQQQLAK